MPEANETQTVEQEGDVLQVPVLAQPVTVDPNVNNQTGEPQGRTFTAEDIAKARREEKDKLYPRLQTMEEELATVRREREEREATESAERQRLEAESRKAAEEEMSTRELLQVKEQEWQSRFDQLSQQQDAERALFERERQFQQLQEYRAQRLAEEGDNLMPELLDLVRGNTQEEVDNSIALVRTKTDAILEQMRSSMPTAAVPPQRGASITSPPVGPMDNESAYQTLTPADIAGMDMDTYSKYRDTLLTGLADRNRNKGLYG